MRLYRVLLRLLPGELRARWGPDMEEVFAHRLVGARGSWVRTSRVWARGVADILVHAVADRAARGFEAMGRTGTLEDMMLDLRHALRALRAAPLLSGAALATLALGIAAATTTFSVVHPVLLAELPYAEPDRLVMVWPRVNANGAVARLSQEELESVECVSGISRRTLTLTGAGEPLEVGGTLVSVGHFELLGASPVLGRTFAQGEDLPGRGGVVLLSHDFWVRVFGADPDVLGRSVQIAGAEHDRRTVIGVMPAGFRPVVGPTDVWVPLEGDPSLTPEEDPTWYVNVASLLLARGEARARELSVRAALGAGRGRVALLLLTEAALLGAGGAVLGILSAYVLVGWIVAAAPLDFPRLEEVAVRSPVRAFAVVSAVLATAASGLVPGLRASRAQATAALGRGARGSAASGSARVSRALVGLQVALSVVVVVGSGLMMRSLGALLAVDPGLDGSGVLTFRANPPGGRYADGVAFAGYYGEVLERVRALPGVASAGAINLLPGTGDNWSFPTYPEGAEVPEGAPVPNVNFRAVWPGYFETVRIPLLAGRLLGPAVPGGRGRRGRAPAWPGPGSSSRDVLRPRADTLGPALHVGHGSGLVRGRPRPGRVRPGRGVERGRGRTDHRDR